MQEKGLAKVYFALTLAAVVLFIGGLAAGSVPIPIADVFHILAGGESQRESWRFIVLETRLPQTLTALFAGGALSASGLLLQTAFKNPLAAPDIFGVTSGASLMVALVSMGPSFVLLPIWLQHLTTVSAAFAGAMIVTLLIWVCSKWVRNSVMLIIVGIMIGYLASSATTLLNFFATEEGVKDFAVWGMGNFGNVSLAQMPLFATMCSLITLSTLLFVKPLNAMLLGEYYSENMGISYRTSRNILLLLTGLLTAIVTAYCGPIAFISLAVPHIARFFIGSGDHRKLLPVTILTGCTVALLCNLLTNLPGDRGALPLNAVTSFIGAPVIIYVLLKH
ncbi:MAG: iron chelate uptake ABC transporter family permease subunit [Prevotella sp.]|jgi:iron complex transport system permease protein